MMNETERARRVCAQFCDRLSIATPLTFLHIGAEQTTVLTGPAVPPDSALTLAVGDEKTVAAFFRHLPPTPDEMEIAIMTVEDEIMRIRHQIDTQRALCLCDSGMVALAEASGIAPDAQGWHISQEDIELLFKRFEQVMLGRPASWEAIPLDNAFSARLLILREFMHHLGFLSVFIAHPAPDATSTLA